MPGRPSIGDVMKNVGRAVQASAAQLAAGAAKSWFEENRVELLQTIEQAKTERGAALLHEFCCKVPLAAGIVAVAMKGSPEMAIAAVGMYDPDLGAQLQQHRGNLEKLQAYWRAGAEQQK